MKKEKEKSRASRASALEDSILIEKPSQNVFQALVNPDSIDKISRNIVNVQLATRGLLARGSSFTRILYSHGIPNFQTVTVEEFELDRLLTTTTTLVGFDVTYRYVLTSTPDGKTLLSLKKDGQRGWIIFKPLLIHLLTRPEHDGDHLRRIKQLVESSP
ncbi:MAG: hypothetical protein HZB17_04945 [Chloroflexi bacterium]|nr:hypothetical protein [Chloroflexota bacterium]